MSRRWTDREMDVLAKEARPGRTKEAITAAYNAAHMTRKRSVDAIVCKVHEMGLRYGRRFELWTEEEIRLLSAMAGRATIDEMRAALLDECGSERTIQAIRAHLLSLGRSWTPDDEAWMSTSAVGRALGCAGNTVILWCRLGLIPTGGNVNKRYIRPQWILDFIDASPMRFDPSIMAPGPFRNRVELRQREGRWLNVTHAAAACGMEPRQVSMACLSGELPADRARRGRDGGQARWWIKASDLMRWHAQIPMKAAS